MGVRLCFEVVVEDKDVIHEGMRKLLHVFLVSLATSKLSPCEEEILHRDDILVRMREAFSMKSPPPTGFARTRANQRVLSALA